MNAFQRSVAAKVAFFVGAAIIGAVGGADAFGIFGLSAFVCWVILGLWSGWWPGIDTRIDAVVLEMMRRLKVYRRDDV